MTSEHISVAFLFDGDEPTAAPFYGYYYKEELIGNLLKIDNSYIKSFLLYGDVLLYSEVLRPTAIKYNADKKGRLHTTTVMTHDKNLLATLVFDLANSITSQWHSVILEDAYFLLSSHNVYCITCPTFPKQEIDRIDALLKNLSGYKGAFEIDLGNPLQYRLFIVMLLKNIYYEDGILFFQEMAGSGENPLDIHYWVRDISIKDAIVLPEEDFSTNAPLIPLSQSLSERGKVTQETIDKKSVLNHKENVVIALWKAYSRTSTSTSKPIDFSTEQLENSLDIIVPRDKLVNYALNMDHPKGKFKAILFKELLDITAKDWEYLRAQLIMGIKRAVIYKVRQGDFGILYHTYIPVIGLNGITKTVLASWIVSSGAPARLTTTYIASEKEQLDDVAHSPPIISKYLQSSEYWSAIYHVAHKYGSEASNQIVPTPIWITNLDGKLYTLDQGTIGGAYIIVPDARKGFARWLRANDKGYPNSTGSGQQIFADIDSQSSERAEAYAKAFMEVLWLNGIEATYQTYLD